MAVIFLLSGTNWVVPTDWNNAANSIECIGAGGGGSRIAQSTSNGSGAGGGGGAYSKVVNQTYTPGATRTFAIGAFGAGATADNTAGGTGGDTSIVQNDNATTACLAKGGAGGTAPGNGGAGGNKASGTGTTTNSGGAGGGISSTTSVGGQGGGGSAGPNGDGAAGAANSGADIADGGTGGGGANAGSIGNTNSTVTGGAGGNGRGASGGGAAPGGNGTADSGGGGAGGSTTVKLTGGDGARDLISAWVQTSDSSTAGPSAGGGGGAGNITGTGSLGGTSASNGYGGGGGGGGYGNTASGNGGNGRPGIIIITYTPLPRVFTQFDPARPRILNPAVRALTGFQGFIFVQPVVGPPTPANLPYFSPFDPPAKPPRHAVDAITFTTNFAILSQPTTYAYTPFDPPPKPPRHAVDWIAFSGNYLVDAFPQIGVVFSPFGVPPKPPHLARDWIAHSFQFATIPVPPEFSPFDPPAKPPHHAIGWMTWDWFIGPTQTPGPEFGFYMPFSPGRTAKPFGMQHQPQWWTYDIKAQFFPKRDRHDGGHLRRRHPPVYSDEYYDSLRKRREKEQPQAPAVHIPNLLIPLNRLILPVDLPTLLNLPPYRPVPTLTMNPPPFRMATPEEIAMDDEMIIRMLLEE